MAKPDWHYPRPQLAEHYLQSVKLGMMNRIALHGVRRVGKTEFLLRDLSPLALEKGYLPIYVNLWATPECPQQTFIAALQKAISNIDNKGAVKSFLSAEVKKMEIGNNLLGKMGLEFGEKVEAVEPSELLLIAELLEKIVKGQKRKVLLIIDEIQHLAQNDTFLPLQGALRTAFDSLSDELPIIYAGSSRSGIQAMFSDNKMPFYNSAFLVEFPLLDEAFVDHCLTQMNTHFNRSYQRDGVVRIFKERFDSSPFWFSKLIQHLIMYNSSLEEANTVVCEQIILDGGFEKLARSLKPLDKALLITIGEGDFQPYAEQTRTMLQEKYALTVKPASITAALNKLQRRQVLSQLGRSEYIIENAGFVDYLKKTF